MNLGNTSSTYQPYESVGALAMVDLSQIAQQQNLDYLENLCGFIDHMNLNPLWFEQETPLNKLKLLQVYQLAINYSKNLSHNYQESIEELNSRTSELRQQSQQKEKDIRDHKAKVEKMKDTFRTKKHKYYKNIYKNLKSKLREQQQRQHYQRRARNDSYQNQEEPQYMYYPLHPPPYPNHQVPPGYHHQVHAPHPHYEHQQQQMHQHPHEPPQTPVNPLFGGAQIGTKLHNFITNLGPGKEENQDNKGKKPNILISDPALITTKKTNKSILIQKESEQSEQDSQIIARHNVNESKKKNEVLDDKSKKNKSRKTSVDKDDDLPDLMAQSKKRQQFRSGITEPVSKNSLSSHEQENIDSIANIRLGPGSKMQSGSQDLQSKLSKRPDAVKQPIKVSAIREEEEQIGLTLPGESNIGGKKKQSNKQSEPNLEQIMPSMFGGSKFTKKGSKTPPPQGSMLEGKPQRSSKMQEVNKHYQEQKADSIAKKSNEEPNLDQILPSMFGGSKFEKKGVKSQNPSMLDGDRPKRASQMATDEIRASNKSDDTNFALALDSKMTKKQKGSEQGKGGNVLQMYDQKPARKSKLQGSKSNDVSGSWLGIQKKQSQMEQSDDILNSNVGEAPLKANLQEKMFIQRPERSSQMRFLGVSNAKQSPRRSETIEEEQYADDFDVDEQSLMKSKRKEDDMNLDSKLMENSNKPISKKQSKIEEPPKHVQLDVEAAKKGMDKSAVNIMLPSSQSIGQSSKYEKLKDQEFKIKENIMGTLKTQTYASESVTDPFDFISCMPANSIIAKRPLLKSQIHKASPSQPNNTSIKDLTSQKSIGASNHININLINPNNEKEVIKTKKDYKASDKVIEDESHKVSKEDEVQKEGKKMEDSDLPDLANKALESIIPVRRDSKQYSRKNSRADSEIDLRLQDQSKLAIKSEDYRKSVLSLIKQFEMVDRKKSNPSKIDKQIIDDTLKKICKVGFEDIKSIDEVEKYSKRIGKETDKLRREAEKAKKDVEEVLRDEQISMYTPPKLEGYSPLRDSLMYSNASFKESSLGRPKKIEAKDSNLSMDMAESVKFDGIPNTSSFDPNLPKARKSSVEKEGEKGKEGERSASEERKQSKSASKYILQSSKAEGKQEQQNLLKNVGEGIDKYDKDDELNKEVMNMMKQEKGKEEDYEDDFQWD